MQELDKDYWEKRYSNKETGWNLGAISTPIKEYTDQLTNKDLKILIPGCGFGYEAEYLYKNGFSNVHILDYAQEPLDDFLIRNPNFPVTNLHRDDFFLHEGKYDLILEQTLFCAIAPSLRKKYAEKMSQLLVKNGKLVGVLFSKNFESGPPFGGDKDEYETYFSPIFSELKMNECYNSIPPRTGSELFINFIL